jgi:hypothetical protein
MKKILIAITLLALFWLPGKAQVTAPTIYKLSVKDTLIDADTTLTGLTSTNTNVAIGGNKSVIHVWVATTKISGTVAGNVFVTGTVDGTNYQTVSTTALTDQAGTKVYDYTYTNNAYKNLKVYVITSGTVHVAVERWVLAR